GDAPRGAAIETATVATSTTRPPLSVLLVDQSPTDSALLHRLFRDGLTVVGDADAALDAVRRQSFAAILIAEALPGRSGLELLRELRTAGDTTPVVVLAEDGESAVAAAALRDGADRCVVKEPGFEHTVPAAVDEALRTRAATPAARSATPVDVDVLVVEVAGQRHAIPAADVEEILPAATVLPIPGAPAVIAGVLDVRGRCLPVVDGRAALGLASKPAEPTDHFVVVRTGRRVVALHVDRATGLARARTSAAD